MGNQVERLKICHSCPLLASTMFGETCDNKKYLNIDTGAISYIPKPGFLRGCGCNLDRRTANLNLHCPLKKW